MMRKVSSRNRIRGADSMPSTESSVMIERSYEVPVDYAATNPDLSFHSVASSHVMGRTPAAPNLHPTYRAAASISKNPTSYQPLKPSPIRDDPVCPSPAIRRSQDHIDLHEALRLQLPAFRQSRRWAKTYTNQEDENNKTDSISDTSSRRARHGLACNTLQQPQAVPIAESASESDNTSEEDGICGSARIPRWHLLKNHRLLKSHPMPVIVTKGTNSKIPRRRTSLGSTASHVRSGSKHGTSSKISETKLVRQRNSKQVLSQTSRFQDNTLRTISQVSEVSEISEDLHLHGKQPAISISCVPPENEDATQGSQRCASLLSGLDFGDEWRLSVIEPHLAREQRLPAEAPSLRATDKCGRSLHGGDNPAKQPSRTNDFQVPEQVPQHSLDGIIAPTVSRSTKPPCTPPTDASRGALSSSTEAIGHDATDDKHRSSLAARAQSPKSIVNQKAADLVTNSNLKNARSVDTLAQIEAQFGKVAPNRRARPVEEPKSSTTPTSSPKRQSPSGEPPERPLPELPIGNDLDNPDAIRNGSSHASSPKSRRVPKVLYTTGYFGSIDQRPCVETILPGVSGSDRRAHMMDNIPNILNTPGTNLVQTTSDLRPTTNEMSNGLMDKEEFSCALRVRDVVSKRNSKIQEIKRRHIADLSRPRSSIAIVDEHDQTRDNTKIAAVRDLFDVPQMIVSDVKAKIERAESQNLGSCKSVRRISADSIGSPNLSTVQTTSLSDGFAPVLHNDVVLHQATTVPSRASPTGKRDQSKHRKLKPTTSSSNLQPRYGVTEARPQTLGLSQIMVVVDTNPHTFSFSAGSRPTTPASKKPVKKPSKPGLRSPTPGPDKSSADVDDLLELIDIVKPPSSIQKGRSARGLRSQVSFTKAFDSDRAKNTADEVVHCSPRIKTYDTFFPVNSKCVSPSTAVPTNPRKPYARKSNKVLSIPHPRSDLHSPTQQQSIANLSESGNPWSSELSFSLVLCLCIALTSSVYLKFDQAVTIDHRKDQESSMPSLAQTSKSLGMIDSKVEKSNSQTEQTIEHKRTLKKAQNVAGRVRQSGNRRYVVSPAHAIEQEDNTKLRVCGKGNEAMSATASSIYSTRSSVRKWDDALAKSLDALMLAYDVSDEDRRISRASTATIPTTDTDTDTFSEPTTNIRLQGFSEGSLTDSQDPHPPPRILEAEDGQIPRHTTEYLGTNLDEMRARLQATCRPAIPVRRRSKPTTMKSMSSMPSLPRPQKTAPAVPKSKSKTSLRSRSDRLAVAPWEALEEEITSRDSSRMTAVPAVPQRRSENPLLELHAEGLRTDQMDALLIL